MMRSVQVLVAGGGASGMMAAIMARRRGAGVLLLEKKSRLGKKILATGNGKCNFTNRVQSADCYRSSQPEFSWSVIQKFGCEDSVDWFTDIGILVKDRNGYLYPASGQASSVLHAMEREIKRLGVEVHTEEEVLDIRKRDEDKPERFEVAASKGVYLARNVILSTGGMASPVHGSTGDGYDLAKKLGHHIVTPVPALTSLILEGNMMKAWSGVRIHGKVSLYDEKGVLLGEDFGEIQMVAYGISGIPVFQLSRFAAREAAEGRNTVLYLDSMPDYGVEWLVEELLRRQRRDGAQSMGDVLDGMLPDKLAGVLLRQSGIDISSACGKVPERMLRRLAGRMKQLRLPVRSVSDFTKAQVTAGGVCVTETDPGTMESLHCRGLYLTGELLDVDGICGGYNLQWAWATGYLAGLSAGQDCAVQK